MLVNNFLVVVPSIMVAILADPTWAQVNFNRRDFSGKVKQFRLHESLTTATAEEIQAGSIDQRRLARNAVRLGVDTEEDRDLISISIPQKIVNNFNQSTPKASKGPRFVLDDFVDPLSPQEGPGVKAGFPKATREFWTGKDANGNPVPADQQEPKQMWEVIACPVVDVPTFLLNPERCVVGDGVKANLFDFIGDLSDSALSGIFDQTLLPILFDIIFPKETNSLRKKLETLTSPFCDIIQTIQDISTTLSSIPSSISSIRDLANNILKKVTPPPSSGRKLSQVELLVSTDDEELVSCSGHKTLCVNIAVDDLDCSECGVENLEEECKSCQNVCYQPIPEMSGLCIAASDVRILELDQASFQSVQSLQTRMLARHIDHVADSRVIEAFHAALGTDGHGSTSIAQVIIASSTNIQKTIADDILTAENTVLGEIRESEGRVTDTVQNQCAGEDVPASSKNHLDVVKKLLRGSGILDDAKDEAAQQGMKGEDLDLILDSLFDSLDEFSDPSEILKGKLKGDERAAKLIAKLQESVLQEISENEDEYLVKVLTGIVEGAVDPETKSLDLNKLIGAPAPGRRNLQTDTLADKCKNIFGDFETILKNTLTDAIKKVVFESNKIFAGTETAMTNAGYPPKVVEGSVRDARTFIFTILQTFDPLAPSSPFKTLHRVIISAAQGIASTFLFGCNSLQPDCSAELPSQKNEVISIVEARDGKLYLNAGCDTNFEGELVFIKQALDLLEKVFDSLMEVWPSVGIGGMGGPFVAFAKADMNFDFAKVGINYYRFVLYLAQSVFGRLEDTCGYLDAAVEYSFHQATYENVRWALTELACRKSHDTTLKRGYGCDGLDNTCDEDKKIDECAEDVFPPEISVVQFPVNPFKSEEAAADFVKRSVSAQDDCRPVRTDITTTKSGTCNPTMTVTATAEGCGERPEYDVSSMDFSVNVDSKPPIVSCELGVQDFLGLTAGEYKNSRFSYEVTDDCTSELDIEIEILSDEYVNIVTDMVLLSSGEKPSLFVRDRVCWTGLDGACKISTEYGRSREYKVVVRATDDAGNVGEATCSTIVGEKHAGRGPHFHLMSKQFTVQGNSVSHPPANLFNRCTGCYGQSSGYCKQANGVCQPLIDGKCPYQTEAC